MGLLALALGTYLSFYPWIMLPAVILLLNQHQQKEVYHPCILYYQSVRHVIFMLRTIFLLSCSHVVFS
jgi:hypothetical protein